MTKFKEYIDPSEKIQGDHVIGYSELIIKDFIDSSNRRNVLFSDIIEQLNFLSSNFPDYDTGYLKVSVNTEYTVKHKMKIIPLRFLCFLSISEKPEYAKKEIYVESGIQYLKMNNEEITIKTPTTFIDGSSLDRYIRLLLWR